MARKRRRRRAKQQQAVQQAPKTVSKITPPVSHVPTYDLVGEEKLQLIHDKSMQILEEGGIGFYYDDEATEILRAHGVKVVDDVAYFDREMVMEYLAKAPSQFTWSARNPERDVIIGGNHVCFAPVVGPPFVVERDQGRRSSTHQDLINFLKLTQMSPYLHCNGPKLSSQVIFRLSIVTWS